MYHSDRSDGLDRHLRGIFPVLMSQAEAQAQFWHPPEAESVRGVVRFNDDVGRRWQLDNLMHLERAPDDNWTPPAAQTCQLSIDGSGLDYEVLLLQSRGLPRWARRTR